MAEAVAPEVAEEVATYRTLSQQRLSEISFGKECGCGRVYSERSALGTRAVARA